LALVDGALLLVDAAKTRCHRRDSAGSKAVHELEAAIAEVVREQPALGIIDGTGSDGTIWEIFLEGEDLDAV